VFRKDKDVEFTIFLPHRSKDYHELAEASLLVELLLKAAIQVMDQLGLDTTKLIEDLSLLEAEFRSTPNLLNPRKSEIRWKSATSL
jgi:hypothetical protein